MEEKLEIKIKAIQKFKSAVESLNDKELKEINEIAIKALTI